MFTYGMTPDIMAPDITSCDKGRLQLKINEGGVYVMNSKTPRAMLNHFMAKFNIKGVLKIAFGYVNQANAMSKTTFQ